MTLLLLRLHLGNRKALTKPDFELAMNVRSGGIASEISMTVKGPGTDWLISSGMREKRPLEFMECIGAFGPEPTFSFGQQCCGLRRLEPTFAANAHNFNLCLAME